jgi:RHS repeat-associated protein
VLKSPLLGPATPVSKYDYTNDALARRTSVAHSGSAFGSSFTQTLGYNDRNELTSSTRSDSAALARAYAYDPIGNRGWSDANSPAVRTTYVTNNLNQYTQQHRPVGSTTWMQSLDYDEDGNLIHSWAAGDMNCDGHVDPNDVAAFNVAYLQGETAYYAVYPNCDWLNGDTNGDGTVNSDDVDPFMALISGTTTSPSAATTYVWDGENRLVEVRPTFPASTANPKKVNFVYDYLGRRVSKKVYNWVAGQWATTPSLYRKYVWDGWLLLLELDGNSTVLRKFTWGLDLAGWNGASASGRSMLESAGGIGGLLALYDTLGTSPTTDDRTFLYFYDGNGNVGQLVETTTGANFGRKVKYEYDPYGKRTNTAESGEYDQPWLFSTKQFDAETGLGYWGYRYYNPSLGRWMGRDPIGRRGGPNLVRAFGNNAVGRIDALGLSPSGVLDGPHDALMHYLIGGGQTAELSSRLIGSLKNLDWYHELILTTIPEAVDALIPTDCRASTQSASASGGAYGVVTAPVDYVEDVGYATEPNYSFDLNAAIGSIKSVTWKVTCTVGTVSKPGHCCCGYATGCIAHFVLDDVYTFNTGYKDYVFQKLFGDWWGGEDYKIHNEWDDHVAASTRTICK